MQLVLIVWEDSRVPRNSWEWITDDLSPECTACQSVGFVIAETESAVLLSPTIGHEKDGDKQMIGAITIAKRQIVKTICLSSSAGLLLESKPKPQRFFQRRLILGCSGFWRLLRQPKDWFFRSLPCWQTPMNDE